MLSLKFLTVILITKFSYSLSEINLNGWWVNSTNQQLVNLVNVDGVIHIHNETKYIYPNGNLSHTLIQSSKIQHISKDNSFDGHISYFDSRGCSYEELQLRVEIWDENTLNIVYEVPLYQYVKTTKSRKPRNYRHHYCTAHYPYLTYRANHFCSLNERDLITVKSECRLINIVEKTVQLTRQ